ncbi:retropepsin-like aspartic protease family protein [Sphingobium subterraneum]|uniref:Aspartyl protease family protein n=1 Tax=Sphingobium subterraneum TaxID=627688 RepID=A0A841IXA1_9SPHN|nr:retropepsin-like aspartic protease [Sphingobium subterraneum]MBB6123257.1 aspartyl protease family protein [Sphingobium subterraneum]
MLKLALSVLPAGAATCFAAMGLSTSAPADVASMPSSLAAVQGVPTAPSSDHATLSSERTEYVRAPDGLFYVNAHVNGHLTRFVVDTGASVVVLNRDDAERLNVRFSDNNTAARIKTVGGPSAMRWAQIDTLTMAGKELAGVKAAVVETGIGVSLLGQNALSQFGTVTLRGNVLTIS